MEETITNNEKHVCCICGKVFRGWGNNPWPLKEDGECCDECKMWHVLPARLRMMEQ